MKKKIFTKVILRVFSKILDQSSFRNAIWKLFAAKTLNFNYELMKIFFRSELFLDLKIDCKINSQLHF